MYTGRLKEHINSPDLSPELKKAFSYLSGCDFSLVKQGRYEVDGDNISAIVQEYQTQEESRLFFESHYDYMDIQYIVSGQEKIQICDRKDIGPVMVPYKKEEDIIFYKDPDKPVKDLILSEGDFAVFKKEDCHKTRCSLNNKDNTYVKKVIVKVKL